MWAFARLKPGLNVEQAKAELEPLFSTRSNLRRRRFARRSISK
jgi:hypothetical protein